ncbi:Flagellar hook-length control protein [Rhodocyclaceae bacterium]|nr:Flagellar hook-length control protein [Rhodocyclaceae bacterium]
MSPELNVAPSPSPVAPQPSANTPAPAGNAGRDAAADAANGGAQATESQPFANVLQKQMKQYGEGHAAASAAAKKARDALLDLPVAGNLAVQDELPTDELAALLPMLPALGPQVSAATEENLGEDATTTDPALLAGDGSQAIVVTAAPVTPVATPQATVKTGDGETAEMPLLADAAKPAATPAILAEETAVTDEVAAAGAKKASGQESFESVLTQMRDMPVQARTQHNEVKNADASAARVQSQVGTPAWNAEIGDRLTWMAGNKETKAELVLTPPQMGRIEISLTLTGDQANASFVSANPAVREALESALPRLREILNEAGISLGQAQVGAESFQQSSNDSQKGDNASRGQNGAANAAAAADTAGFVPANPRQWLQRGNGLVDLFA